MRPPLDEPVRIQCGNDEYQFQVGDRFYLQYHRHGSVGEDAEIIVENDGIISVEKKESEYLHPERMKPGMTGGDAEHVRWFFRAASPGTTKIIVRKLFRFEIEDECSMKIVIV
ncbi:MAG: protease inhibitor I42 family protein [Candidatus Thorarchaeota archaeon]|nr:protease inhibitor I42 family protein [Candidatus Thorarchaeota archaeon]